MLKKIMSLIMVISIVLNTPMLTFANTETQVITLNIGKEDVTYYLSNKNQQRIVEMNSNGIDYVIIYDESTDVLTINGKKVNATQYSSTYDDALTGNRPKTKNEWHFYANADRTEKL